MTARTGLYVHQLADGTGASAQDSRLALAGLLAHNSDGTVRTGVLADGQGPVVTGATGMSYKIRKHVAVTKVSEANGPTLVPNDGEVTVTTDPAPGANSRIDVIWVRQRHIEGDGGTGTTINTPEFGVEKGATSATPPVPSLPTGAVELARATVTANTQATSGLTITQGQQTVTAGGRLPIETPILTYGGGTLWGVPFNPAIHRQKVYTDTIVNTPNAGGDIALVSSMGSQFVGAVSAFATYGDVTTGREIPTYMNVNTLAARILNSSGGIIVTGGQRINFVVYGWVNA